MKRPSTNNIVHHWAAQWEVQLQPPKDQHREHVLQRGTSRILPKYLGVLVLAVTRGRCAGSFNIPRGLVQLDKGLSSHWGCQTTYLTYLGSTPCGRGFVSKDHFEYANTNMV